MLRLTEGAAIHLHAAPWDVDVVCMEGQGMTSLSGEVAELTPGRAVRWSANLEHGLWTEGDRMVVLIADHASAADRQRVAAAVARMNQK
jgi:quercetin dioxygenase-like cupin family protein